jgi:mycothiol synthase
MSFTSRNFVGVEDLPILTQFFDHARDLLGHAHVSLHAGDVWWRYGQYEPERHQFRLWFDAQRLIGVGWVISGTNLEIHLHPTLSKDAYDVVAREIIDWAKSACPAEIRTESLWEDARFMLLLESSGFVSEENEGFLMYSFDLQNPLPDLELPPGYQVRHVLESEFAERISVHQDAFNSSKFTPERYARVRSMPGYRSELDLVVATPENSFASFCIVWLSNGAGLFEPVGTRVSYQKRGLGKAVILEGFRRLKALGAQTALVFSEPKNRTFYESCGFVVINHFKSYVFQAESDNSN